MEARLRILNLTSWYGVSIRRLIGRVSRVLEKKKVRTRYIDRLIIRYNGATTAESFGWYLSRSRVLTLRLPRPAAFMPADLLERMAQASTDSITLPPHHAEWLQTDLVLLLSVQEPLERLRVILSYLGEKPTPTVTASYNSTQPPEVKYAEIEVRLRDLKKELQETARAFDGDIEFQRRQIRGAEKEIEELEQVKVKRVARIQKGIDSLTVRLARLKKPNKQNRKVATGR